MDTLKQIAVREPPQTPRTEIQRVLLVVVQFNEVRLSFNAWDNSTNCSAKRMDGSMKWKIASASVTGTSHHSASKSCEDCHTTRVVTGPNGAEILVAIAADGAGSAAPRRRTGEG